MSGLRKTQPLATASSGAGPSTGKPRPMNIVDCYMGRQDRERMLSTFYNVA